MKTWTTVCCDSGLFMKWSVWTERDEIFIARTNTKRITKFTLKQIYRILTKANKYLTWHLLNIPPKEYALYTLLENSYYYELHPQLILADYELGAFYSAVRELLDT